MERLTRQYRRRRYTGSVTVPAWRNGKCREGQASMAMNNRSETTATPGCEVESSDKSDARGTGHGLPPYAVSPSRRVGVCCGGGISRVVGNRWIVVVPGIRCPVGRLHDRSHFMRIPLLDPTQDGSPVVPLERLGSVARARLESVLTTSSSGQAGSRYHPSYGSSLRPSHVQTVWLVSRSSPCCPSSSKRGPAAAGHIAADTTGTGVATCPR